MPSPASPGAAPHRRLAAALAGLHRVLMQAQAEGSPAASNPYALLQAVMHDPGFAWLRSLSGLMARIDEAGAKGATPGPEAMSGFLSEAGALTGAEGEFRTRMEAHARRPEVAGARQALDAVLAELRRGAAH